MKDEFIPPERIDRDSFFAGLCMGIMADGAINRLEAWALFDWLVHNDMPHLENIKKELEESLVEDGKFGSKAGKKLSGHLEKLLGKTLPAWPNKCQCLPAFIMAWPITARSMKPPTCQGFLTGLKKLIRKQPIALPEFSLSGAGRKWKKKLSSAARKLCSSL